MGGVEGGGIGGEGLRECCFAGQWLVGFRRGLVWGIGLFVRSVLKARREELIGRGYVEEGSEII